MNRIRLRRIIQMPLTVFRMIQFVGSQKNYLQRKVAPALNQLLHSGDGSVDKADVDKILKYYGLGVPAVLGEAFCMLRGTPMTKNERKCATSLGAITGLFDDFFDKHALENFEIEQLMEHPDTIVPRNDNQKLFQQNLIQALSLISLKELYLRMSRNIFKVQIESHKQKLPQISASDLESITWQKGGYSVLFYRSAMNHTLVMGEKEALYELGAAMQLGNDIFDVFKDSRDKIYTIPTTTGTVSQLRETYLRQLNKAYELVRGLDYPEKNIQRFINIVHMAVACRVFVALNQYEKLQESSHGRFLPGEYTRQELICDMEKPINIMRMLKHFVTTKYPG